MRQLIAAALVIVWTAAPALAADVPDGPATEARITVNVPEIDGRFETAKDSDWYRVRLVKGGSYAIVGDSGGEFDSAELRLRDAKGKGPQARGRQRMLHQRLLIPCQQDRNVLRRAQAR